MKQKKKKLFLVPFFALYHLFMPFVMINCGQDVAFTAEQNGEETDGADQQITAEECRQMEFTTEDCVAPLTNEGEAPPQ